MKKSNFILVLFMGLFLASNLGVSQLNLDKNQKALNLIGVFDGFDFYVFKYVNEDGDDDDMYFNEISDQALKSYNLKSETFNGKKFEVTYSEKSEIEIDDDGDEQEVTIRTIISLKLIE